MTSMVIKMQRWKPPLSTKPTQRWQSREEILKEYWDSLSPAELLRVNPTVYALRRAVEYRRKFDPDQPRVPAGNSDGGQWTSEGASSPQHRLAARRISPSVEAECEEQKRRDDFQCRMVGLRAAGNRAPCDTRIASGVCRFRLCTTESQQPCS